MYKEKIVVKKLDEVFMQVMAEDNGILRELNEYFTFMVPGYQFMPLYKNKMWDGKFRLFQTRTLIKKLYVGLLAPLVRFCESRDYDLIIDPDLDFDPVLLPEELESYYKFFASKTNSEFKIRDYQSKR